MQEADEDQSGVFVPRAAPVQDTKALKTYLDVLYGDLPSGRWIAIQSKRRSFVTYAHNSVNDAVERVRELYRYSLRRGTPDDDVYVGVNPTAKAEARVSKSGNTYIAARRDAANIPEARFLFVDLDVKDGAFASPDDAIVAIGNAVKARTLPMPNMMVSSGGGVHVYWKLDRWLPRAEWQILAAAFESHVAGLGFKFDRVTKDIARILRPPGTWNCKDAANPKEVRLLFHNHGTVPVARLESLLGISLAQPGGKGGKGALPPKAGALAAPKNALAAGIGPGGKTEPTPFAEVLKMCPTLADVAVRRGAGDSEPLWNLVVLAASFYGKQGRAIAHALSDGHAGYTKASTNAKFDQKVAARASGGDKIGWPTCDAFARHSQKCQGCALRPLVKSPLGIRSLDPDDLPRGYVRRDGAIWRAPDGPGDAGEDADPPFMLLPCDVRNALLEDTEEGPSLALDVIVPKSKPSRMYLPLATINTWRDKAMTTLGKARISLPRALQQPAQGFFVAFVEMLQARMASIAQARPFGWTNDGGFTVAGTEYMAGGGQRRTSSVDTELAAMYTPAGEMEEWRAVADFLTSWGRVDMQAMMAVAFAAPLVDIAGLSGLVVSAYGRTGVQKSCAVQAMMSVWGAPKPTTFGVQNTTNSVMHRLGTLRNLPMAWDEVEHDYIKEHMPTIVFQFVQGVEKSRLTSDIQARRQGTWATMMLLATNFSVQSIIGGASQNQGAAVNRVFEFEIQPMPPESPHNVGVARALRIFEKANRNYGHAGRLYASWLVNERAAMRKRLHKIIAAMEAEAGAVPEERFWLVTAATLFLGAANAKHLGLVNFDLDALYPFLVRTIKQQRGAKLDLAPAAHTHHNVVELLYRYISYCKEKNRYIMTDIYPARGKAHVVAVIMTDDTKRHVRAPAVHVAKDAKAMRLLIKDFHHWLVNTEKQAPKDVVQRLIEHAGLTRSRVTWCGGTEWVGPQMPVYELDLSSATTAGKLFRF
jgi:hypothetical protein